MPFFWLPSHPLYVALIERLVQSPTLPWYTTFSTSERAFETLCSSVTTFFCKQKDDLIRTQRALGKTIKIRIACKLALKELTIQTKM